MCVTSRGFITEESTDVESVDWLALTYWGGHRGITAWQQLEESLLNGFFALAVGRITCNHQPIAQRLDNATMSKVSYYSTFLKGTHMRTRPQTHSMQPMRQSNTCLFPVKLIRVCWSGFRDGRPRAGYKMSHISNSKNLLAYRWTPNSHSDFFAQTFQTIHQTTSKQVRSSN